MPTNEILQQLAGNSIIGAILVWFMLRNTKLTDRLFDIIKENTQAQRELKSMIKEVFKIDRAK